MGSVNVNGRVTRRPGVYSTSDVSALGGQSPGGKSVALVGDFPFLEQAAPVMAMSPSSLLAVEPGSELLKELVDIIYSPSNDQAVRGAPSRVYLVGAGVTTQATRTLLDAGGAGSLVVNAKRWGYAGNRIKVTVAANTGDATKWDYTLERDAKVERFTKIGSGLVLSVTYDETEATTMALTYAPSTGLRISYTKTTIALGTYTPSKMAFDGTIKITPSGAPAADKQFTAVISGINRATGSPETETLTWLAGDAVFKTSTKSWNAVTTIVFAETGAAAPTFTIEGRAFDLQLAQYPTAKDAADHINHYSGKGFDATIVSAKAAVIGLDELDETAGGSIKAATISLKADLWAIETALGASSLVEVERAANATKPPVALVASYLSGGSAAAPDADDYETALASLENLPIHLLWLDSQDSTVHAKALAHCVDVAGSSERQAWLGTEPDETRDQIRARLNGLNSQYAKLVAQEVELVDYRGRRSWVEPNRLALMLCGMQAGVNVGTSLTWKRPRVIGVRQGADWTPASEVEEMLEMRAVILTEDEVGWRVEDDLTTWQEDDNPALSDGATVEGCLTHVRETREAMRVLVADEDTDAAAALTLLKKVLRQQVADGRIVSFDDRSATIRDEGEVLVGDWDYAPRITKKFVVLNSHAVHATTVIQ
jgi:hypothetical protein